MGRPRGDRAHGHNFYFQNTSGYKRRRTASGTTASTSASIVRDGPINNITLNDIYIFDSGRISSFGDQSNYYMGAGGSGGGST